MEIRGLSIGQGKISVSLLDLASLEERPEDFLTPSERDRYVLLGGPKRRKEYLGARICLKEMLLKEEVIKNPRECRIDKDRWGRPYITFLKELDRNFDCSISHKGDYALAAVTDQAGMRIGVDIEPTSERLYRLRQAFVNEGDLVWRDERGDLFYALCWAAKEAASKAIGLGMMLDFKEMVFYEMGEGSFSLLCKSEERPVKGQYFFRDNYCIALAQI